MATLHNALQSYEKKVGAGLKRIQSDYHLVQGDDDMDCEEASRLAGKIYTVFMYDTFIDHLYEAYSFIDKASVQKVFQVKMTDAQFDDWIADNVEWFMNEKYLPNRTQDLSALFKVFEDILRSKIANDDFMNSAVTDAAVEIPEVDRKAFIAGMEEAIGWIGTTLVPDIVRKAAAPTQSAQAVKFAMPTPGLN